jgi:hypothetical protein
MYSLETKTRAEKCLEQANLGLNALRSRKMLYLSIGMRADVRFPYPRLFEVWQEIKLKDVQIGKWRRILKQKDLWIQI